MSSRFRDYCTRLLIVLWMGWLGAPAAQGQSDEVESAQEAKLAKRSRWWSLQPLELVQPPVVTDPKWTAPVDRFIHAKLKDQGLAPAAPAEPETLLRRLAFVLTGLPPTPQQLIRFQQEYAECAEAAIARQVDAFLSSPHFGERFARHWMDVVRYTDTYGYEWDNPAKGSWEYRDYLIRAFNDDVGFDQLIREQLAGDLLPEPRVDRELGIHESLIGPMFYHLGEHRHGSSLDFNGIHQEMIHNKIDAFSKTFLAMTVACARCHDHKLDEISQADYYALAGVFMSPRWSTRVIDAPGRYDSQIAELKSLRQRMGEGLAGRWNEDVDRRDAAALKRWSQQQPAKTESPLGDPAWPLVRLAAAKTDEEAASIWGELNARWRAEREKRIAANGEKFTVVTDFREPGLPPGWVTEGDGMRHGFAAGGEPLVALAGNRLVQELLLPGYHTHALSSKLPGALRLPPEHEVFGNVIDLKLRGGEWGGYLVVPQNAFQTEEVRFLAANQPATWTEFVDKPRKNGVSRVRVEVVTSELNPNFPPRTGVARAGGVALANDDAGFDKRSWFSVTGIVRHDQPGAPSDTLEYFADLFRRSRPETIDEAWQHIERWCDDSLERWADGQPTRMDIRRINWMLSNGLLLNAAGELPELQKLVKRYRDVEETIGFPRTVNSMDERDIAPLDYRLNIRGNVDDEGPGIDRDFLEVFHGYHDVGKSLGSGRLALARYLSSRDNPQTARVYVNRIWQWVFGTGIVATPNDFGKLGNRPSHPALLDWLAERFMKEDWSTKQLVRHLVLSRTFRQSGEVTEAGLARDPDNRLLHHYPTRRLEAEAVRDNLLAVSGRLDAAFYGPPIDPPRAVEDDQKRLFAGPLDSHGRRSLYMKMSIMAPPKFLVGFNLPELKLSTGRRDVTNVPAQALIMLNDPLVTSLADHWADRLVEDASRTPEQRVRRMFRRALARDPRPKEILRWSEAVQRFRLEGDIMTDRTAWSELAHALMNTKEFLYYR